MTELQRQEQRKLKAEIRQLRKGAAKARDEIRKQQLDPERDLAAFELELEAKIQDRAADRLEKPRTGFDRYLEGRMKKPSFARGYARERAKILREISAGNES